MDFVRRLDKGRDDDRTYPFRDAVYRDIDHILRRLEGTADATELQALRTLLPEVRDRQAVCTRMEWTIRKLDKDGPFLDGHCQINWRDPT